MLKIRRLQAACVSSRRHLLCLGTMFLALAVSGTLGRSEEKVRTEEKITWQKDYSAGVHESVASKKPMLIVVGTDWCGYCRKLFQQTLPNPVISALLNDQFIPIHIDADKNQELARQLKVEGMPTLLIVSPERKILRRINGFQSATELNTQLAPFKKVEPTIAAK